MREVAVLLLLLLTSCKQEILHELTETQANQAWVTLSERGIEVEKTKGAAGWSVSVEKEHAVSGLKILQELKLPGGMWREKTPESSSFVPSKDERQMLRERNLARTLEGTLLSLPGVVDVRVHLVLPLSETKGSGSVLLVASSPEVLSPQQVRDIAAGASGIPREQIAIAVVTSGRIPGPLPELSASRLKFPIPAVLWLAIALVAIGLVLLVLYRTLHQKRRRITDASADTREVAA